MLSLGNYLLVYLLGFTVFQCGIGAYLTEGLIFESKRSIHPINQIFANCVICFVWCMWQACWLIPDLKCKGVF